MIKCLFFDLGSTLIDESLCNASRLQLLLNQKNSPGRGEVVQKMEEFSYKNCNPYLETAKYFGLQTSPWPSDLEKLYPESIYVVNQLRKHYKIGIIANQNPGIKDRLLKFGILELFDVIISSGELGIAKPDRRMFDHALVSAGIRPDEAVMIGDRLDNDIAPASEVGMQTVWVRQGIHASGNLDLLELKPNYTVDTLAELLEIFL